eukprot:CAMPEP_0204364962 /NCGR_PEP_ID=MMETSP0469-20131031/41557_1 /ASSEMBLY_ACC=CAM_ASM_000384 /TAXON_ID=2969 /ORGANISM="Oxyrrhis marina" /LENGTH=250 /DNA_ID=CAMNT_0051353969 /DNA_START=61 /DNA_END=810 /DNA_ORIENTATION=-
MSRMVADWAQRVVELKKMQASAAKLWSGILRSQKEADDALLISALGSWRYQARQLRHGSTMEALALRALRRVVDRIQGSQIRESFASLVAHRGHEEELRRRRKLFSIGVAGLARRDDQRLKHDGFTGWANVARDQRVTRTQVVPNKLRSALMGAQRKGLEQSSKRWQQHWALAMLANHRLRGLQEQTQRTHASDMEEAIRQLDHLRLVKLQKEARVVELTVQLAGLQKASWQASQLPEAYKHDQKLLIRD